MIVNVDPLLEPANGPNWFPFDPDILYEIKIDNNNDAVEDIVFQFRFGTEQRLPGLFQAYAGAGGGHQRAGQFAGAGAARHADRAAEDHRLRQRRARPAADYTVTMIKGGVSTTLANSAGAPFYALPANVGPRTMDYAALFGQATYTTSTPGVKVFSGTVDDPFWIDLGAAFDTLNLRSAVNGGVLSPAQDASLTKSPRTPSRAMPSTPSPSRCR